MQAGIRTCFLNVDVFTIEDLRAGNGPVLIKCVHDRGTLKAVPAGMEVFGGVRYAVKNKAGKLIEVGLSKHDGAKVVIVDSEGDVVVLDQTAFESLFAPTSTTPASTH